MKDMQAARDSLSLDAINFDELPRDLIDLGRWVMWRSVEREGRTTKPPFETSGRLASSTDSTTWTSFEVARTAYDRGGFSGMGFVLTEGGGFVGVDLDGCRNPETGDVAKWASDIVDACGGTYAEISPSRTGIKLFARGSSPITGKNKALIPGEPACGGKAAGLEVYDRGRYFAVTGWRLPDSDREPCEIPPKGWDAIRRLLLPPAKAATSPATVSTAAPTTVDIVERAWRYLEKMPDSIAGQRGHDAMFAAACKAFEFGLTDQQAAEVLSRFNSTKCNPTWSDRELEHKLQSARAAVQRDGRFGVMLRDDWRQGSNGSPATSNATRHDGRPATSDQSGEEPATEPPAFTRLMTCAELLEKDLTINFLVDDILVEGQPCVIGGASKSLKTSITVDLAVSLATGASFLGEFQTQQRRVAIWSGESGAATLRSTAKRVAKSREIDLRQADLHWCFDLPKLSRADHLAALERTIIDKGLQVIIIDPLYLSLIGADDAGSAGNLYAMGARLFPLSEIGQQTGCTMVVLHHCRKARQGESADSMGLESLSQSGISEWARQWVLVKRRSDYQFDGRHELWMQAGGSAGHSGQWGVDVNEGTMNKGAEDGGRFWEIELRSHQEITEETADRRSSGRDESKRIREESRVQEDASKVVKYLKLHPEGDTRTGIRDGAGLNTARNGAALLHLEGRGEIAQLRVIKNGREEDGFKYVPTEQRAGHVAADFGHGGRVASFDSWNDGAGDFDQ